VATGAQYSIPYQEDFAHLTAFLTNGVSIALIVDWSFGFMSDTYAFAGHFFLFLDSSTSGINPS